LNRTIKRAAAMFFKNVDTFPDQNITDFCAAGASVSEEIISVNVNVALRVLTFIPPGKLKYPAVMFIPGWVSQMFGWKEVLLDMTKDFKIYYVETREKISSKVQGKVKYDVESIGLDIVTLIENFNLKNREYILFGSSLGGTTILDLYRFLKQKPLCLVLVGPNAVFRIPRIWIFIVKLFYPGWYDLIKPSVKWYLRKFRLDLDSDYAQYEKYCRAIDSGDPWKLKKGVLSLCKYEIWPLLKDINIPTLMFGASKDKLHEPDNLRKMVRLMPQATYLDLQTNQLTHSQQMVEQMRKYLDTILAG
jgi:pimeloyl-ACP methyl ester carboxylesterase